jgi:hypothetical protein
VPNKEAFNHQVRRTAFLTVGLAAALVFGIIVLVTGDWIPGTIIVAATLIGLAQQVPVIRRLCSEESSPSPQRDKPAHQGGRSGDSGPSSPAVDRPR